MFNRRERLLARALEESYARLDILSERLTHMSSEAMHFRALASPHIDYDATELEIDPPCKVKLRFIDNWSSEKRQGLIASIKTCPDLLAITHIELTANPTVTTNTYFALTPDYPLSPAGTSAANSLVEEIASDVFKEIGASMAVARAFGIEETMTEDEEVRDISGIILDSHFMLSASGNTIRIHSSQFDMGLDPDIRRMFTGIFKGYNICIDKWDEGV